MKSKFLRLKNKLVHYLIGGQGDYLIILPSLWVTSKSYEEIGEKLSKYFTVVIPDIYKGNSKFKKPTLNIKDNIFLLNSFINELHLTKYYLLGISIGGVFATIFTNTFPKKIKKLLLISSSATFIETNLKVLRLIIGYIKLLLNNSLSIKGLKTNLLFISDSIKYFLKHPKQYILEGLIAIKNYGKPTLKMKVNSKLIFAKKDEFIPFEAVRINSQIENLKIEVVDKTHAWMFIEQEEMVKRIREFFI